MGIEEVGIMCSITDPGEMFRQFSNWFYKENRLKNGTLAVSGKPVDLKQVTMPLLNIYATQDHIVPPAASTCLQELVASLDYVKVPRMDKQPRPRPYNTRMSREHRRRPACEAEGP